MQLDSNKIKGNFGLSIAIGYFGSYGYTISIPLNDTQWYDLIVEKDNIFQTVQCKFCGSQNNELKLTSCGGTNGKIYDRLVNHPNLDILFCVDKDMNLFLIPMKDLFEAGNINSIRLRTERSIYANKNSFDTSKYLVYYNRGQ